MPRSGTTLTEQIISAHNLVDGAGELVYLQSSIKDIFFEVSFKAFKTSFTQNLNKGSPQIFA